MKKTIIASLIILSFLSLSNHTALAQDDKDMIFTITEEMPSYNGGEEAYNQFLMKNIKYPKQAQKLGIEGRVFLTFIVNKDGSLDDLKIERGIGAGCDKEALRVFKKMPNWKPGVQRGKKVRTQMTSVITFRLPS